MAHPGGRPPFYKTPEELQERIDDYFEKGITMREVVVGPKGSERVVKIPVPTITGLVLHCGFESRDRCLGRPPGQGVHNP